jgi:2-polyprenyl-3-methyl-5-hydroxy-6-metoxy-1,4-benzoquinol methylase
MKTEHLNTCPSCGSNNIHPSSKIKDYFYSNEEFEIWECKNCSLKFTQNRPVVEEIGKYYDSKNYASHDSGKSNNPLLLVYKWARSYMLQEKFELIRQFKPEWKQVLDYGTGEGFFVEYLLKKGKDAIGIEPSPDARENFNRRTGQTLLESLGTLSDQQTFQVISLWHVLEHIHDLHPTIKKLVQHLEPKGIMVIAVPNQASLDAELFNKEWAAWDVPRHLYHWNSQSLGTFLSAHGLTKIYTGQLPLDPFYIGLISSRYQGKSPLSGLLSGMKSYFHGKNNPEKGSTLLTIWMKN